MQILLLLLSLSTAVGAQTSNPGSPNIQDYDADRAGVRRAVLDYVEGFYEGDTLKLSRSIWPEVYKFGYWIPRDSSASGAYVGEQMTWPEFHAYANRIRTSGRTAPPTASKEITIFDVLDQTASAKLVAFWGVDYLLLAKQHGRWMITHVLWQNTPPGTAR